MSCLVSGLDSIRPSPAHGLTMTQDSPETSGGLAQPNQDMALLSLRQAEKLTGVSRTAIQKAISRGRLSASKDDLGQWAIDASELTRVYPPLSEGVGQVSPPGQVIDTSEIEVRHLREKLEMVESERDYLREALSAERELVVRLSYQPVAADRPIRESDKASPPAMMRWWIVAVLMAAVAVLAGGAVLLGLGR